MKAIKIKILHALVSMSFCLPAAGYGSVPFADVPLFLDGSVKPNVMFVIDDSGSMDAEIISAFDGTGRLFNSGASSGSNVGGWNDFNSGQLPFDSSGFWARSSEYNALYYNPDSTYTPWPDSADLTLGDSPPGAALFEPTAPSKSPKLDLTSETTDTSGNKFMPATYFEVVDKNLTVVSTEFDITYTCDNPPAAGIEYDGVLTPGYEATIFFHYQYYPSFTKLPTGVDALGPDNRCLRKVEIASGTDEMQNFANWFTYYRRIHHATRSAIGDSLEGLAGIRVGTFGINNRTSVSMKDLDTERGAFLDLTYDQFGEGYGNLSAPLRRALKHAGAQFDTNTNIIQAQCQKNFSLLFTDGLNIGTVSGIGNADGDTTSVYSGVAPYADSDSNTLADVAMYYYKKRLRSAGGTAIDAGGVKLPDGCYKKPGDDGYSSATQTRVVPSDSSYDASVDCNPDLHMTTYTVGFGALGEKFVGFGYESVQDVYDNPPDWNSLTGLPGTNNSAQIDDLLHAAVNGRGEFYNASNIDELRQSISAAIRDIVRSTGSATNVTFNTATLEQGSEVYTASFNSGDWSGSVAARLLNPVTGGIGNIVWDAAETLKAKAPADRFIVTNNNGGVPFQWGQLSGTQIDDLNGVSNDTLGPDRLAYIRGDRSSEGGVFRKRSTPLGDVVNSSPAYAGAPASGWPDRDPFGAASTGRYSTFKQNKADRTPMVYVGANDGMLHGFSATTGEELLAYIPSFVYSSSANAGLSYLSDPGYDHRFYVDLSPALSDIYIGDAGGSNADWRTVLVGGLRSGGKGLFALNVTDPSDFDGTSTAAENLVMWEFSHPDLGYITEPPLISLVKWSNNDYRWSAIVPNGYNSENGKTGLFVLDIEGGQDGWTDGSDYEFVELKASGTGLSPLRAVDYQDESGANVRDGLADRIYAGDLNGNMWAIDLSGGSSSWESSYKSSNVAEPLFVAQDSSGNAQPITTAPVMGRNVYDTNGSDPNLFVFFGTGRYFTNTDPATDAIQSFYGVLDQGEKVSRSAGDLETRAITKSTSSGAEVRTVGGASIDWTDTSSTAKKGWVVDFSTANGGEAGERVIESPLVRGEYVLFNTITPSQSLCQSGGTSWTMALRLDGTTPTQPVFDVNNDGKVNSTDAMIGGIRYGEAMILNSNILGDNLYRQASDGEVDQTKVDLGGGKVLGRSGWQEIYDQ